MTIATTATPTGVGTRTTGAVAASVDAVVAVEGSTMGLPVVASAVAGVVVGLEIAATTATVEAVDTVEDLRADTTPETTDDRRPTDR